MNAGSIWIVAGLILCGAGMLHPGVFLLWIGIAGVGAGILTLAGGLAINTQIGVFIGLVVLLLIVPIRRIRVRRDTMNAPDIGLIGETCRALEFQGGEGRVRFRDSTWQARTTDGHAPELDALLNIIGLAGTVLLVERSGQ